MLSELMEVTRKRKRIVTLDILRGFFLAIIIVDHLARFPNGFDFITGRDQLWVSAAEGFVVISGILIGYIYGPRMKSDPGATIKRLLKRALKIYICVLALSFFFMAYSYAVAAIPDNSLDFVQKYHNDFLHLLYDSLTLQYVYGWGEFLSHYVIYLFLAPFILYALLKKKEVYIAVLSVVVWYIFRSPLVATSRYSFTLTWQLLFVAGSIFGYYLPEISIWIHKHFGRRERKDIKHLFMGCALAIFIVSLYLSWGNKTVGVIIPLFRPFITILQTTWDQFFLHSGFDILVDKTSLGPLRIFFGIIVFWALFIFFADYDKKLPKWLHDFFRTLGEKSLFVYGLQAVVVFFVGLYIKSPTSFKEIPVLNTGVTLLALVFIYYVTKNTAKFKAVFHHAWNKVF